MAQIKPDIIADITLYPTDEGGRRTAIQGDWYSCPCLTTPSSFEEGRDCRILLYGQIVAPGETARLGVAFLSGEEAAARIRAARQFFLWEGGIIGEGRVVSG